jgi:hypothetical protein
VAGHAVVGRQPYSAVWGGNAGSEMSDTANAAPSARSRLSISSREGGAMPVRVQVIADAATA